MAFVRKWAYEALLSKERIDVRSLPKALQAAIRVHQQDFAASGGKQTPELLTRAEEIRDDIEEWYEDEDEDDEPTPAAAPEPEPVPVVVPDPLTNEQVLMQLHGQGRTQLTAAELKSEGFTKNPGATGCTVGAYTLTKAMFGTRYTLTKKR